MDTLAFRLYLVFVCSWFLHLPTRYEALASIRADLVLLCLIAVLCVVSTAGSQEPRADRRTRRLLWTLVIYIIVTLPLVEWPGSVVKTGFPQFLKGFVFFPFTVALVTTRGRLKHLLIVFIGCQMFRVFEPLYLHLTQGYWGSIASMADWEYMDRLSGAPDDVVNPNGLAAIVLTVLPFLHYLTGRSVAGRLIYLVSLPFLIYVLVLTGSRSGLVGLAAIFALVWWKSRHKVALLAVVAATVLIVVPRLSPDQQDRYTSIFSGQTKNSATVQTRLDRQKDNLQVTMHRPLFGHGLGTSREANFNFGSVDQLSHNLYLEISQELGVCGLVIFLMFMRSLLLDLAAGGRALRRSAAPPTLLCGLVPAVQVFIGMNVLFSFASYGLSSYEWYLTAGLTEVLGRLTQPAEAQAVERAAARVDARSLHPAPASS